MTMTNLIGWGNKGICFKCNEWRNETSFLAKKVIYWRIFLRLLHVFIMWPKDKVGYKQTRLFF